MNKICIALLIVGFSCKGQTSREIEVHGEWQEYKIEVIDPPAVTVPFAPEYDGPKYHLRFLANGKVEDITHDSDVQIYMYTIVGNDLHIGDMKYGIESISKNELVLLIYKGILDDDTNGNPYSDRLYMKRKK